MFSDLHNGYEDNFIHMIKLAYNNIQSKTKINDLLSDLLTLMLSCQSYLYNITAEVLVNVINADKTIKEIEIGDHGIKIVNSADNTTIFLRRGITCLNKILVILKLYENAKINQHHYNLV